jgi:hypothetical protein
VIIKDLLGRLMIASEVKGEMNIPTRQLPDGVYLLFFKRGYVETYRKIVVKH